jgi:prepilin peptidase dependent protein C
MTQQKGFSLIEVLLSLMLTTTVAFFLLHLQGTSHSFLHQFIVQTQASILLDRIDEELLLGVKNRFKPVDPYTLHIEQNMDDTKIQLSWFNQAHSLTRIHRSPGF